MPGHELNAPDFIAGSGALSGYNLFKDADPATVLNQYAMNALFQGLRRVMKSEQISGDLTAASGAADQAEGFIRLEKGLRRMARRIRSAEIGSVAMTAVTVTFAVDPSMFVYIITEADTYGPYADGGVYPSPASPTQNNGRTILMINASDYSKLVGHAASGKFTRLQPGESCFLYGQDLGGGVTTWIPIGKSFNDVYWPTVSCKLYAGAVESTAFNLTFLKHAGKDLVTLHIPFSPQITFSGTPTEVTIAPAAGGVLPSNMRFNDSMDGSPNNITVLVTGLINDVPVMLTGIFADHIIKLTRFDLAAFSNGNTFRTYGFQWTYFGNP